MKLKTEATIHLATKIPGPLSTELQKRREASVPRGVASVLPIFVRRANGVTVEDVDGNRFLDFTGGIGCQNAGHCQPEVVAAIQEQSEQLIHSCFMVTPYEGYVQLAEKLNMLAPGDFRKKTFFVNSGAEAVENAVKIARHYTGRQAVIAFEDSFHGRTWLAMGLTGKSKPYKTGFGPSAPDIYRMPFANCYRCAYHLTYPACKVECAHTIESIFRRHIEAEAVAALIFEPVLGEGGFIAPPSEWFEVIARKCRENGILLIADEIQTGFCRTGPLFACERFGVEPDLILSAKSIAGGLPLAAITGRADIMDSPGPGGLGGTFGGNPLACAAALETLRAVDSLQSVRPFRTDRAALRIGHSRLASAISSDRRHARHRRNASDRVGKRSRHERTRRCRNPESAGRLSPQRAADHFRRNVRECDPIAGATHCD